MGKLQCSYTKRPDISPAQICQPNINSMLPGNFFLMNVKQATSLRK